MRVLTDKPLGRLIRKKKKRERRHKLLIFGMREGMLLKIPDIKRITRRYYETFMPIN